MAFTGVASAGSPSGRRFQFCSSSPVDEASRMAAVTDDVIDIELDNMNQPSAGAARHGSSERSNLLEVETRDETDGCEPCTPSHSTGNTPAEDAASILRIAIPTALTMVLRNGANVISTAYCGHMLASRDFAAVATGLSFAMLTALSIGAGISSAMDTLSTQAFGKSTTSDASEGDKEGDAGCSPPSSVRIVSLQGMYLRQSLIVTMAVYIPIVALYVASAPLIRILVAAEMASEVIYFLQMSWFIVVPMLVTNNLLKFSQSQQVVSIGLYASLINAVVLGVLLYAIRPTSSAGVLVTLGINRWLMMLNVVVLTWRNKALVESWGDGWLASFRAGELSWQQLVHFFSVGLPSLVANCADTWSFEVMAILAASIGPITSAAWSVLMTTYGILFSIFVGVANAASITVGTEIGRGHRDAARRKAKVVLMMTFVVGSSIGVGLCFFGVHIYNVIQSNPEVTTAGGELLHLGGFTFLIDVLFYVMQGIYRGIGRQKQCAVTVIIGMWLVAIPVAVASCKWKQYDAIGILIGLTAGLIVSTPLQFLMLFGSIDWDQCIREAHDRIVGKQQPRRDATSASVSVFEDE